MTYLISYGFHLLVSLLFFLLIPFSFLIKGLLNEKERFQQLLRIYSRIIWVGHGALIVSIITGFLMTSQWLSPWFLLVILIWIAIGAFLGMTAKMIRLTLAKTDEGKEAEDEIAKLRLFSFLLMLSILSMFTAKILPYV